MRIKRNATDALFSTLVRERAGWCCEFCQKYYPEGNRMGLECAHIFSRRHKATRWLPNNAISLCTSCHVRYTGDPVEFTYAVANFIGQKNLDWLAMKKEGMMKVPAYYEKEIRKRLRSEHNRMLERRANGERGRIDFESPY